MGSENVGNYLEGNDLQGGMSASETVEEKSYILRGEVLRDGISNNIIKLVDL